jgi:hypothetical protein
LPLLIVFGYSCNAWGRNVITGSNLWIGLCRWFAIVAIIKEIPMAGSVLSESKTNNLAACSRSGFGLHSNRPLDGLTIEEAIEFKAIEALPPFDENGNIAWTFEGEPTTSREKRWLELYRKQERAGQKGEPADQRH